MGFVYLIWANGTTYFKVGFSKFPTKRLKSLQTLCPLELVLQGTIRGTKTDEKNIHHRLRNYRVHGEWFELPEPAVWGLLGEFGASP